MRSLRLQPTLDSQPPDTTSFAVPLFPIQRSSSRSNESFPSVHLGGPMAQSQTHTPEDALWRTPKGAESNSAVGAEGTSPSWRSTGTRSLSGPVRWHEAEAEESSAPPHFAPIAPFQLADPLAKGKQSTQRKQKEEELFVEEHVAPCAEEKEEEGVTREERKENGKRRNKREEFISRPESCVRYAQSSRPAGINVSHRSTEHPIRQRHEDEQNAMALQREDSSRVFTAGAGQPSQWRTAGNMPIAMPHFSTNAGNNNVMDNAKSVLTANAHERQHQQQPPPPPPFSSSGYSYPSPSTSSSSRAVNRRRWILGEGPKNAEDALPLSALLNSGWAAMCGEEVTYWRRRCAAAEQKLTATLTAHSENPSPDPKNVVEARPSRSHARSFSRCAEASINTDICIDNNAKEERDKLREETTRLRSECAELRESVSRQIVECEQLETNLLARDEQEVARRDEWTQREAELRRMQEQLAAALRQEHTKVASVSEENERLTRELREAREREAELQLRVLQLNRDQSPDGVKTNHSNGPSLHNALDEIEAFLHDVALEDPPTPIKGGVEVDERGEIESDPSNLSEAARATAALCRLVTWATNLRLRHVALQEELEVVRTDRNELVGQQRKFRLLHQQLQQLREEEPHTPPAAEQQSPRARRTVTFAPLPISKRNTVGVVQRSPSSSYSSESPTAWSVAEKPLTSAEESSLGNLAV